MGLVNQYLDALAAKDPKWLPLSADVSDTEQEQVMAARRRVLETVTGRGNYNHYFADPVAGQVGWMGTMRERGGVLLMSGIACASSLAGSRRSRSHQGAGGGDQQHRRNGQADAA